MIFLCRTSDGVGSKGPGNQRDKIANRDNPFVGREAELALLSGLLDDARHGKAQFVAISGGPGMGKTTLARAAAGAGVGKGFAVLSVRCHEGEYVAPYWPWIQILQGVLGLAQETNKNATYGQYAELLATVLPRARQLYPDTDVSAEGSAESFRLRVHEGAAGLLGTFSAAKPVLIILDNLHCADVPSLRLLEFIVREMADWRLTIIAAHRDAAPGSGHFWNTLGALANEGLFTSMKLTGWDATSVREFLSTQMTGEPPPELVDAIIKRTEGNPLFVSEVARLIGRQRMLGGGTERSTWEIHIPEKVRLAILSRIRSLSDSTQRVLALAALAGREFELALLQELQEGAQPLLDGSLQEALKEGMIEEISGRAGSFRFTHVLIQEGAIEALPSAQRAGVHLRIGEALERRYGVSAGSHAAELALHFEAAGQAATAKAVQNRQRAGEGAFLAQAYEDGYDQFSRALAGGEGLLSLVQKAELLSRLAQCQHELGKFKESLENHRRAFDIFMESGDRERALAVIIQPHFFSEHGTSTLRFFERAISLFGKDSALARRLGSHYGLCLYLETADLGAATRLFQASLVDAQKRKDRPQEAMVFMCWARVLYHELQFERSLEMISRALQWVHEVWGRGGSATHLLSLVGLGRLREAEDAASTCLREAEMVRHHLDMSLFRSCYASIKRMAGDIDAALSVLADALSHGKGVGSIWFVASKALMEYERGNGTDGARYLAQLPESADPAEMSFQWHGWLAQLIPYIAWLTGEELPLERAEADAAVVAASPRLRPGDAVNLSVGLGLMAVMKGDTEAARQHYAALLPFSGRVVCPYHGTTADHLLGVFAGAFGELPLARRHFDAALDFCRKAGMALELAYTCRDYARILVRDGLPEDSDKARACCHEAWGTAQRAGLVPLMRQLKELRGVLERRREEPHVGADASRAPGPAASLSRRETEVIRLLAEGLSNEQIGHKLFISPHTVANHVQKILEKTQSSNRTDAAIYAVRHALIPPNTDTE
jgi:DNA-binding CsgD family transcriptional regulator/tetratricopeptide (TPR) repeat protein